MNIAEKLQELRKQKGISQPKLCEELEKTQGVYMAISTLRNYENVNNPRIPKNEILNALAKYYNVDIEYLLNDEAENITTENIKINEVLGLSDSAISNLNLLKKEADEIILNDSSFTIMNTVNSFISSEEFRNIIFYINELDMFNSLEYKVKKLEAIRKELDFTEIIKNDLVEKENYKFNYELLLKCESLFEKIDSNVFFSMFGTLGASRKITEELKRLKKECKKYTNEAIKDELVDLLNYLWEYIKHYYEAIDIFRYRITKELEKFINDFLSKNNKEAR